MKQLINFKKEKHFLHLAILCILIEIISMSKWIDSNLSISPFTGQAAQWGFHFFKRKLFIFRDIMSKSVKKSQTQEFKHCGAFVFLGHSVCLTNQK